jgi:sulfofructose kinase
MGAILCDCFWPAGAKRLIAASARRGLPSVLDADVNRHDRATIAPLVAEASHVVFSRGGLAQFASTDDIADGLAAAAAARSGPARLLGVTDGADGLYIWTGGGVARRASPRSTRPARGMPSTARSPSASPTDGRKSARSPSPTRSPR